MLFLEFLSEGIHYWKDERYKDACGFFFVAFLAFALLMATPYFTIESINYLFSTTIPFDIMSWCAVWWLIFLVRTTVPMGRTLQQPQHPPVNHVWVTQGGIPTAPRPRRTERNREEEE
jgi:hypothetical protein